MTRLRSMPERAAEKIWVESEAIEATVELLEHSASLHPDVQKHNFPIFEHLSKEDLLQRCLGGHTQNANESFNSTIWRFAPKHLYSGLKIIEISAFIAAGLFNEGYSSILKNMSGLDIIIGRQSKTFADDINEKRVIRQERCSSLTKEARQAAREQAMLANQLYEETEGLLYGPGIAD
ncbi:PREDICTED: uncharacterized protein LOC105557821 [Vollenhovia emeryi]|uniref:uncharacterized protein LOC105557821 n=1 Tax=Vollenhovia emeryi TaxID=411798 RepID=UPI0005F49653|nr:PREDICTED: uncharacterized protein LOC105557821 [Vollenhovia emeryi]